MSLFYRTTNKQRVITSLYLSLTVDLCLLLSELNVLLVGTKSSLKYLVGNMILGKPAFDCEDITACCQRTEGKVCGRRVTLAKAPGWLKDQELFNTPEIFKTEAILSVTPALHCFILMINTELTFKESNRMTTKQHLEYFYGDKVWNHTVVVFSRRGHLGQKTIKDYIRREGAPLQALLAACGNRYLVLCENGEDIGKKVEELFETISALVAKNGLYEIDSALVQNTELKRREVAERAVELHLKSQHQRKTLRNLLTGQLKVLYVQMCAKRNKHVLGHIFEHLATLFWYLAGNWRKSAVKHADFNQTRLKI